MGKRLHLLESRYISAVWMKSHQVRGGKLDCLEQPTWPEGSPKLPRFHLALPRGDGEQLLKRCAQVTALSYVSTFKSL